MASRVQQQKYEKAAAMRRLAENQAALAPPPPRAERKKERLIQQAQFVAENVKDNRQVEKGPAPIDQSTPAQ